MTARTPVVANDRDGAVGDAVVLGTRATGWRAGWERGTAAVEFALVLPLLLLLVLGIVDFGRAFNAKVTVTHAAREGARALAISGDEVQAIVAAQGAATGTPVTVVPGVCVAGEPATVSVTHEFSFITPLSALVGGIGPNGVITLTSVGSMRCGG